MLRRGLCLLAIALSFAPTAEAHRWASLTTAREIARERFPGHCRGVKVFRRHHDLGGSLARADTGGCRILSAPRIHTYGWPMRCTVLVHEYGHLAGRGHSENPDSVMYPTLHKSYRGCRR